MPITSTFALEIAPSMATPLIVLPDGGGGVIGPLGLSEPPPPQPNSRKLHIAKPANRYVAILALLNFFLCGRVTVSADDDK